MPNCTLSGLFRLMQSDLRPVAARVIKVRWPTVVQLRHVTLDDVLDTLEEPAFLLLLDGIRIRTTSAACASPMPLAHTP